MESPTRGLDVLYYSAPRAQPRVVGVKPLLAHLGMARRCVDAAPIAQTDTCPEGFEWSHGTENVQS